MTDRQTPRYVAQRISVAQMTWDQCMMEYSKKGLCPNYEAMLEARLDEHQAQFDADNLGNAWRHCDLN